nr:gametocyte-specific factor 1-like isoform X3 [Pelodiscus sinensis]|eukprot:XP_025044539.1 gametocyte-specific factor 1-like isoform X3 [Pelodiscus sinensis]
MLLTRSCLGVMDPERLMLCPYDKNHQIRASRFPYHLVKCRENNKKIAKELATCPYNARHKVPKRELQLHISTCTDNTAPELFSGTAMTFSPKKDWKETPRSWQGPPCQEDWEAVLVRPAGVETSKCRTRAPPQQRGLQRVPGEKVIGEALAMGRNSLVTS